MNIYKTIKPSLTKVNLENPKYQRDEKNSSTCYIFSVKHDGQFRTRVVANGHLTDTPIHSVYTGVVSLRGFWIVLFLVELNGMTPYATNIGNAYLEAYTSKKVCIKVSEIFGEQEGHLLLISKARYGLKSSGLRFNILLAKHLTSLGFIRSKCKADIWYQMSNCGIRYEYVPTYVDDLCAAVMDPLKLIDQLQSDPINFKLNGNSKL